MWEEDPKWQQSQYRLLVWSIVVGVVGGFLLSLGSGDWQAYWVFLEGLGIVLAALGVYGALAWASGHLALKVWSAIKKHKNEIISFFSR